MVRLLQKLLGDRHRGVDRLRSPAGRALTQPGSPALGARRSCRLQIESLEDRLTPSGLDFFPVANVVAVNPQPLPPQALVEFDPLPNLASATAGTTTEQIHLVGTLSKQITIPSATAGTAGQTWTLNAFYVLSLNASETIIPPTFEEDGISAPYILTGTVSEILTPVAPTTGATWVFSGTISEQGAISGPLTMPSATVPAVDVLTWNAQITEKGTETPLQLPGPINVPPGPTNMPWTVQAAMQSTGTMQETVPPPNPSGLQVSSLTVTVDQNTRMMQDDTPINPGGLGQPSYQIDGVFSAAGSVTQNVLVPATAFTPEVDTGTTQYTDSLMETILMPDGSTQTLAQTSMDMGIFVDVVFPIPTCTSC